AGPGAVRGLGSARSTLETQVSLHRLFRKKGWEEPGLFADRMRSQRTKQAVARLEPDLRIAMQEMKSADYFVAVGADPLNEAPVLALAMRQAQRRGAEIVILDARPVDLPFSFLHVPASPSIQKACLGLLLKQAVTSEQAAKLGDGAAAFYGALETDVRVDPTLRDALAGPAESLRVSTKPVIVCGTDCASGADPDFAADCALLLRAKGRDAGLFFIMPGANAFGAALLSRDERSLEDVVQEIEEGTCKALILVETDPFHDYPDRQRLTKALDQLEFLLVLDYLGSPAADRAQVFLPTKSLFESGGIFINQEGRAQGAAPTFRGGTPILQISGGDHPPRTFRQDIPGAEPTDAWRILGDLAGDDRKTMDETLIGTWIKESHPAFEHLPACREIPHEGTRILGVTESARGFSRTEGAERRPEEEGGNLRVLLVDRIFGTEELSSASSTLQEVESEPELYMNAEDAALFAFQNGERLAISSGGARVEIRLGIRENMARGHVVLPRHHRVAWQELGLLGKGLHPEQITRSDND
ncbi:MAG: molybdopterin-dependent oxidoreductase, partial [Thermodesulfobacteriota bacterium]